jgi:3-oxoacyl-[acyl-carrier protein] reductase/2-deoxy-D-gluconate 3-dehydrogenase
MDSPVVVVTGAGTGLGRAIALDLARRRAAVVLAGRTVGRLEQVAAEIRELSGAVLTVLTDVSDPAAVDALFAEAVNAFGTVDVLVNNAGITGQIPMTDMSEQDWDRIFDVNVRGLFLCCRAAAKLFSAAGRGRAVNVASVFGLLGRPGFSAYCASKGAVINFTRSAAAEWARFSAQINAVAPGYFATDINRELRADPAATAKVVRRIPARRMGEPAELANVVTYLALDAPSFLTGQTIAVDGGESSV